MFEVSHGNVIVPRGDLSSSVKEGLIARVDFAAYAFMESNPEVFERAVELLRFRSVPEDFDISSAFSNWLCVGFLEAGDDLGLNTIVEQKTAANPLWGIYRVGRRETGMPTMKLTYTLGGNLGHHRTGFDNTAKLELQIVDIHGLLARPEPEVSTIALPSGVARANHKWFEPEYDNRYEQYETMYD